MTKDWARYRVTLASTGATEQLGASIAGVIEPGDVVLLFGELGTGKTVLTKGFVRALNTTTLVTSPTFALCHLYDTEPRIAHVDCWRLRDLAEFIDLGLDEVLDQGGVAIIEWGELAVPLYESDALVVQIDEVQPHDEPNDQRVAIVESLAARWHDRLPAIITTLHEHHIAVRQIDQEVLRFQ